MYRPKINENSFSRDKVSRKNRASDWLSMKVIEVIPTSLDTASGL